jgi:hypothetical protein
MADIAYPEPWLRAWAIVLENAPGDEPPPRVDVVHVRRAGRVGPYGKYDPRRHVVVVYADSDRAEALGTLVHEFAHAWAPNERGHHGPEWQRVYCQLFAWLTGIEILLDKLPEHAKKLVEAAKGSQRISNRLCSCILDVIVVDKLRELEPMIWHRLDDSGSPRAVEMKLGSKRYAVALGEPTP